MICSKHKIEKYRRHNSILYYCPKCLNENNQALLKRHVVKVSGTVAKGVRRKTSRQRAMDRADQWFSRYIRLKHSFRSGKEIVCKCYTCGRMHSIKNIECGHWQRRGYKPTRYSENNARPQCTHCNKYRSGVPERFEINLIDELGSEIVDNLKRLSQERGEDSEDFYRQQAERYRIKFNSLIKQREIINPWRIET